MKNLNSLLVEYYKRSLLEGLDSPPPPPGTPITPNGWWQDSNGRWHQTVPSDQPDDLVPIETEPEPQEVDPMDITINGGPDEIPPQPPEQPGQRNVLMRRPIGIRPDGSVIFEYYWVQIKENSSMWRRLINILTRTFIPGIGWVLFNPFEQSAGAGSDLLMLDPYGWAEQYGMPYGGGWDDIQNQNYYA